MMQMGGNQNLCMFFQTYGLMDESNEMRLGTEACAHYRRQLTAMTMGEEFNE